MQVPKKLSSRSMAGEPWDFISELPDVILHYILSLVPIKDAAQTSILSKRWERVWATLPYLNFGRDFLEELCPSRKYDVFYSMSEKKTISKINKRFLKVVNRIILNRCQVSSVQKLHLIIPAAEIFKRKELFQTKLDRWVRHMPHLEELDLRIDRVPSCLTLPSTILSAKSIEVLSLLGFNLMSLSSIDIKFPSLRKLRLDAACMDDDILQKLILGCPLVEDLRLRCCRGLKNIYLTGLLKLKRLIICGQYPEKLEIDAPVLQYLSISSPPSKSEVNIASCACLRILVLHGNFVTGKGLSHIVSQCVFLDNLDIGYSRALENIKITTDTLKGLTLNSLEKLVEVEINTPRLEKFIFTVKTLPTSLPTCLLNASQMLEVQIEFDPYVIDDLDHNRLSKFLGNFSHLRRMELVGFWDKMITPKEKRGSLESPLFAVKDLMLVGRVRTMKFVAVDLVEYMLWLSPRPDSLSIKGISSTNPVETKIVLKFLYEENVWDNSCWPCCKSFPIKCWRHYVVEVRIEECVGEEDSSNLKNFFLRLVENLNIVEK